MAPCRHPKSRNKLLKTLICTPAYGGMVNIKYMMSLLTHSFLHPERLKDQLKYEIGVYTLGNESLISRARNNCAQFARTKGFDRVLFIDADVGWTWNDLRKILDSKEPIIAGLCPLKTYPLSLNFVPFKEDADKYFPKDLKTVAGLKKMAAGHQAVELPVAFVGTAFMQIDVGVFNKLIELNAVKEYQYPNAGTNENEVHHDFFQTCPISDQYFSEDWGFCHLARQAGYEIKVHSGVFVTHTGSHTFQFGDKIDMALGQPELVAEFKAGDFS